MENISKCLSDMGHLSDMEPGISIFRGDKRMIKEIVEYSAQMQGSVIWIFKMSELNIY